MAKDRSRESPSLTSPTMRPLSLRASGKRSDETSSWNFDELQQRDRLDASVS